MLRETTHKRDETRIRQHALCTLWSTRTFFLSSAMRFLDSGEVSCALMSLHITSISRKKSSRLRSSRSSMCGNAARFFLTAPRILRPCASLAAHAVAPSSIFLVSTGKSLLLADCPACSVSFQRSTGWRVGGGANVSHVSTRFKTIKSVRGRKEQPKRTLAIHQ